MEEEIRKQIRAYWDRSENQFPTKQDANDPEYCKIPTTRIIFSNNRKILDIEDIVGNNIRLVEKEEAEWLIEALKRYVDGLK